jgi:hypothetical protein
MSESRLVINKVVELKEGWTQPDFIDFATALLKVSNITGSLFATPEVSVVSMTYSVEVVVDMSEDSKEVLDDDFWVGVATGKISD